MRARRAPARGRARDRRDRDAAVRRGLAAAPPARRSLRAAGAGRAHVGAGPLVERWAAGS
jgi:hypothetical protein